MRSVHAGAFVCLWVLGCGGGSGSGVPLDQHCARVVDAACARGARCGIQPTDPGECRVLVTTLFDACPMAVSAVAMGEATYDAEAAATYVEAVRNAACDDPMPDPTATGVFVPQRMAGQTCTSKVSCKTGLMCEGSTVSTPTGICASGGATVGGTITLPGEGRGLPSTVRLYETVGGALNEVVASDDGSVPDTGPFTYIMHDVPAGTYYLLGFVDIDGSGGIASTPGDFAGWYGHNGDGNPPAAPNVVVPASGAVIFDFALVVR